MPNLPEPALVVLVGPAGSGKSHWARARYRPSEIVSSDELRAAVGASVHDLDASRDAFALLDTIVSARLRRRLTTVVDTLGLDTELRRDWLQRARVAGVAAVAVLLTTDFASCRTRNAARDVPVPAAALRSQYARTVSTAAGIGGEGWDAVLTVDASADTENTENTENTAARVAPSSVVTDTNRLRFVLQLSRFPWGEQPASWLAAVAQAAEQVGFDGLALMDHLIQIPQVGRAWEPLPEPFVTLGLLAGCTTTLQLGTLVSPITLRPAGIVAKSVATLDTLSGGRAFLGLGAGWWDREHHAFGVPFPPLADRFARLEDALETVRALWAPGTKAFSGRRVTLPETTCYPRPAHDIPIVVGGRSARILRIAAQYADACNVPSDEDALPARIATLRSACEHYGRDPDQVEVTVLDVPVVGTDREDVARRVARLTGRTSAANYARTHSAGTAAEQQDRYRRLADLGVRTVYVALPDLTGPADLDRIAPVLDAGIAIS